MSNQPQNILRNPHNNPIPDVSKSTPSPVTSKPTLQLKKKKSFHHPVVAVASKKMLKKKTPSNSSTLHKPRPSSSSGGEKTGRWTAEEHQLFLKCLEQHGKDWREFTNTITTRTVVQIRTHAQKYFKKLVQAQQAGNLPKGKHVPMDGKMWPPLTSSGSGRNSTTNRKTLKKRSAALPETVSSNPNLQPKNKRSKLTTPLSVPSPLDFCMDDSCVDLGDVSTSTAHGTMSAGPALEDSLFQFLPMPQGGAPLLQDDVVVAVPPPEPQQPLTLPSTAGGDVARSIGALPILLPGILAGSSETTNGGDVSPTGVMDYPLEDVVVGAGGEIPQDIFPTGDLAFVKGAADVEGLLEDLVAGSLDWNLDVQEEENVLPMLPVDNLP